MADNEVRRVLKKIVTWMERQAARDEGVAENCPFVSLKQAYIADAKNYRAMAKEARVALAPPAPGTEASTEIHCRRPAIPARDRAGERMSEWISMKERLPEYEQVVLAYWPESDTEPVIKARWCKGYGKRHDHFDTAEWEELPDILHPSREVTHWQPLPAPPEESVSGN